MSIKRDLTGAGLVPAQAEYSAGNLVTGLTSTGSSSQANSLAVYAAHNVVTTTGANTGVRLPSGSAGDWMTITNLGASTLFVYPPVGGAISGGSTNAKKDLGTLLTALCVCINGLDWAVMVGA